MPTTATVELNYVDRAAADRANAEQSTGPRTEAGKLRSSRNALRHGLTARTPVLPSEDPAAFELFATAPSPELLVSALASLGLHSARLTRDFQRTLDYLRAIQADRRHHGTP